jgi:hypothetical protein
MSNEDQGDFSIRGDIPVTSQEVILARDEVPVQAATNPISSLPKPIYDVAGMASSEEGQIGASPDTYPY